MKKAFAIILSVISFQIFASIQDVDYVIYKGDTFCIENVSGWYSLLGTYYINYQYIDYPFEGEWSSNLRGHVSTWKIENDSLFLIGLEAAKGNYESVDLKDYFGNKVRNEKVFADWFTGYIDLDYFLWDKKKRKWENDYDIIVKFSNGKLVLERKLTPKDFKRYYKLSDTIRYSKNKNIQIILDYKNYNDIIQNMYFISQFDTLSSNELEDYKKFDEYQFQITCRNDSLISKFIDNWLTNRYIIIDTAYKNQCSSWDLNLYIKPYDLFDEPKHPLPHNYAIVNIFKSYAFEYRCEIKWLIIENEKLY